MKALLLIDIQNDYFKGGKFPLKGMYKAAENAQLLLKQFRKDNLPVFHIQHLNPPEALFFRENTNGADIHPIVCPLNTEVHITKRHPNSFRDTDLKQMLDDMSISELHIAGAMTNMCVDSTVRAAYDMGFTNIVYKDACAAPGILGTRIMHALFIKNLAARFATIQKVKQITGVS